MGRRQRRRCIVLGLTLLFAWPAQGGSHDLLSLYQLAKARDAAYLSVQAAAEAGREQLPQARAALLPQISATAGMSRNDTDQRSENILGQPLSRSYEYTAKSAALNLRQAVYRPAAWAQLDQARARVQGIEAQLEKETQGLALRLAQAYFDALLARERVAALEVEIKAYASQLEAAQGSFKAGYGTRTDIDEARARLDLAHARLIEAQQRLTVAQRRLRALVGEPIELAALATLPSGQPITYPLEPPDLEAWIELAEARNPELRALVAAVEAADQELRKNRAGHLPTLDIVASRNLSDSDSENIIGNRYWTTRLGVQLSLPLYAGGYVDSTVRQALANRESARQQLEAARRELAVQVTRAHAAVNLGAARISALELALRSADQAVVASEKGLAAGIRHRVDVLNALAQQANTRFELFQAKIEYLLGRLQLLQTAGRLDEAEIAQLSARLAKRPTAG